jgi:ribonuclease BN (tRNA processing enzyme)
VCGSGDTRPCQALMRAGAGATLLIHEATFEPELIQHALTKRHCTSEEAMQVAKGMGAYR